MKKIKIDEIHHNIKTITTKWMKIQKNEKVLIITDELHLFEAKAFEEYLTSLGSISKVHIAQMKEVQKAECFFAIKSLFDEADVIIAIASYSIVTSKIVDDAVKNGTRFLSLPLATNSGSSLLSYDFIKMDPKETERMALNLLKYINKSKKIFVTTEIGTNLTFYKENRDGSYFNGEVRHNNLYTSGSFEAFIPIEENKTKGSIVIDGSLGYLGKVNDDIHADFTSGRLFNIQKNESGLNLIKFIDSFDDENMYFASELGIGLNLKSICRGESYIEDESAYGTFHIGFGRNIGLGGKLNAKGHFDLICFKPTIYADDILIIQNGEIVV